MSCVIDLASRRPVLRSPQRLMHPAGVEFPFDDPEIAKMMVPEVRNAISTGMLDAGLIRRLPDAVQSGDRVLVIGAGIGTISTLIAQRDEVAEVIAIEANVTLVPYLRRVHERNGVPGVVTLNAVITDGGKGRVPFFARADYRSSSLLPQTGPWEAAMMVPTLDLNLILADEQISLVVCDLPHDSMSLLAATDLGPVERILVNCPDTSAGQASHGPATTSLAPQGFEAEDGGTAILYRRAGAGSARTRSAWPFPSGTGIAI